MENFSATAARMLPGLGGAAGPAPPASAGGFDMGIIPGFDIIQKLFLKFGLDPSFLVTLGMSLTLLTSLLSFFTYSFSSLTTLTRFISANLVSSATIHSSDVTYLYIMRWLATHRVSTDCRLFCVTSRKNPQSYAVRRYSSYAPYGDGNRECQEDDEDEEGGGVESEDDSLGPRLKYTPAPGFLYFWHKGRPIIINRKLDLSYYTGDIPDETIVLTTIGRSPTFLREILSEARRSYLQAQSRKTMVYTLSPTPFAQKTWDQGRHRPSRDISTVIMPSTEKEHLLCDVKEYLNPHTMRWYAQRGLPYRRGYLFYGPPGTGKTSLSLALAGELKLPLYILSLSTGSLTDETLTMLFVGLPRKCIVLLEDIDCAGVHRNGGGTGGWGGDDSEDETTDDEAYESSSEKGSKSPKNPKNSNSSTANSSGSPAAKDSKRTNNNSSTSPTSNSSSSKPGPPASGGSSRHPRISVSFSGLLNAIDGVASHEGRILIMTTNHRERLDSALIRPGRVDVQMEFGYANTSTLAEIFRELYKEIGSRPMSSGGGAAIGIGFGGAGVGVGSGTGGVIGGGGDPEKRRTTTAAHNTAKLERENVYRMADDFAERIPAGRFSPAEVQGFLMSYKGQPERAMSKVDEWVRAKLAAGGGRRGHKKSGSTSKRPTKAVEETGEESWEAPSTPLPPLTGETTTAAVQNVEEDMVAKLAGVDGQIDLKQISSMLSVLQRVVNISNNGGDGDSINGSRKGSTGSINGFVDVRTADVDEGVWQEDAQVPLNGAVKESNSVNVNGTDVTNGYTSRIRVGGVKKV